MMHDAMLEWYFDGSKADNKPAPSPVQVLKNQCAWPSLVKIRLNVRIDK